jgi:AraC-like DNA-binding protein
MKVEFEKIAPDQGSSFKLIHWRSQDDRFFWHQHPQYEIIYVKKGSGKLHVGNHLGQYTEGEVMFIGPNLPHSGLGYGVIGKREDIIVQLDENFLGQDFMNAPEMVHVKKMFERAIYGIIFRGEARKKIGKKIEGLLNKSGLERLILLMEIIRLMSETSDIQILNDLDSRFAFRHQDEERIDRIYTFVENHHQAEINIEEVAALTNLTVPSFCRYFKKMTNMTFTDFLNEFRINKACKLLHDEMSISQVCFESGFNNISHFNKTFKNQKGQSPRDYRNEIRLMENPN